MTWSLPLLGVAGIVLFLLLRPLFSPLRSVPGPFIARWTDAWYFWKVWQGDFEKTNQRLHETHGPIVRYGPNRYSINDPTASDAIYGHGKQFAKSPWYSTWTSPPALTGPEASPGSHAIFADQVIGRHSQNRKQFQSTYTMTSLVSYEPYVDDCADLFSQRLQEIANAGIAIDMRHWFQCYAFDVIGMITYAKRFGFLDAGEDVGGVIEALESHLSYATLVGIYPSLHPILFPVKNFFAGSKGAGRAYIIKFTQQRIGEHQAKPKPVGLDDIDHDLEANGNQTESFLSKFMSKHTKDPENFTSAHTVSGCVSNMVAGSDTTAISLSAILHHVLENKEALLKLQAEVDSLTASGQLSKNPTFKESQQMPYLQAVIKEALRMHPATGLPLERIVPGEGVGIGDLHIPKGTIVGVNTWVEHRNRSIFGEDADEFRPERWLIDDADKLKTMNRHWIPFGLGSRTCIGRHISMLEMSKLIPRIIRDFEFQAITGTEGVRAPWDTNNAWFVKPTSFNLRVKVRTSAEK